MMVFLRPWAFTLLALCLVPGVCCQAADSGQADPGRTLAQCIERGLSANKELKAAQNRIFQADQVKRQAFAEFLPKFSMSYGYKRTDAPEVMDLNLPRSGVHHLEISDTDNFQWAGTVTQPLFKGFGLLGNYRRAALGVDRAKVSAELARIDLALRIKQAYFRILASEQSVHAADQAVRALAAHLKTAKDFHELEMIPPNELLAAEVALGSAEYERVRAVNDLWQRRAELNTLLARPVDATVVLAPVSVSRPVAARYGACVFRAMEQRPEIRSIQLGIRQIDAEITAARSPMYPEVGLQYRYVREGNTPDVRGSRFHDPDGWEISAALNWTFWQWGKTRHKVAANNSRRDELLNLKSVLADQIRLDVKKALLALDQAEANLPRAAHSVVRGEENLRVSRERFAARLATSTDVLDAQTLLTRAKSEYCRAVYDHHLARGALKRAMGAY